MGNILLQLVFYYFLVHLGSSRSLPIPAKLCPTEDIVDLTYTFDKDTIFWPPLEEAGHSFVRDFFQEGVTEHGMFYRSGYFHAGEHGGTHMDSPSHFYRTGQDIASIPVDQLLGPVFVLNVTAQVADDPDYQVTVPDIADFEAKHGRIADESFVFMLTNVGQRWPNKQAFYHTEDIYNQSSLHFPGFHPTATKFLVDERNIKGLGVDSPSTDSAKEITTGGTHAILAKENKIGLEFLANLEKLPPTGARIIALPMKIANGTGAPARVIAFVPQIEEAPKSNLKKADNISMTSSGLTQSGSGSLMRVIFGRTSSIKPLTNGDSPDEKPVDSFVVHTEVDDVIGAQNAEIPPKLSSQV